MKKNAIIVVCEFIEQYHIDRIVELNHLNPITETFIKKYTNSFLYNFSDCQITEYESSFIDSNCYKLDNCNGCRLIVGNLRDLWGECENKSPHHSSILYSLNEYFDIHQCIFPESRKSIYIYTRNQLKVYNIF